MARLILASASPRRRELLSLLGVTFEVRPADLDEALQPAEPPREYVSRLAEEKALALAAGAGDDFILAADTSVVIGDEVLGKPGDDPALGAAMLRRLSGREHQVITGVCLCHQRRLRSVLVSTDVHVRALSEEEIRWYVASKEGQDKAGGYAVQGLGSFAVARLEGSYANVVGLPACEVVSALRKLGLLATFPIAARRPA